MAEEQSNQTLVSNRSNSQENEQEGQVQLTPIENIEVDSTPPTEPARETTQTDHLNKQLLNSFLNRLNQPNSGFPQIPRFDSEENNDMFNVADVHKEGFNAVVAKCDIFNQTSVTNGGKTTLCQMLVSALRKRAIGVIHLSMDDYYWEDDDPHHVQLDDFDYANWDDVCAVNWHRLLTDVTRHKNLLSQKSGTNVLLVEGIMIFNSRDMLPCFDHKYYITLPKDECWERRRKRVYEPPEPDGYFDKIVWPYYLKFKGEVSSLSDIVFLDGTKKVDHLFSQLFDDVNKLLP